VFQSSFQPCLVVLKTSCGPLGKRAFGSPFHGPVWPIPKFPRRMKAPHHLGENTYITINSVLVLLRADNFFHRVRKILFPLSLFCCGSWQFLPRFFALPAGLLLSTTWSFATYGRRIWFPFPITPLKIKVLAGRLALTGSDVELGGPRIFTKNAFFFFLM